MEYPKPLTRLIEQLKRLPGVGTRTATRFAFELVGWDLHTLEQFSRAIGSVKKELTSCTTCGALIAPSVCPFCTADRVVNGVVCVVATPQEVFTIESTGEFGGAYHVLGGLLSPFDGIGPDKLTLSQLKRRIETACFEEVIVALDSTVEGDATALFLREELKHIPVVFTRLALGIPVGSPLGYVDQGTLARAFSGRSKY